MSKYKNFRKRRKISGLRRVLRCETQCELNHTFGVESYDCLTLNHIYAFELTRVAAVLLAKYCRVIHMPFSRVYLTHA